MSAPEAPPLWKQIGRQSLWGRRGVVKMGSLWLPLAVVVAAHPALDLAGLWASCLLLFAAAVCRTLAVILANDLADRAGDLAAHKDRWVLRLPPVAGGAAVVGLVAMGAAALVLGQAPLAAIAAYLGAVALGLAYSLRPLRFKERGLLGLIAYGLHGALAYALVTWAWLGAGLDVLALLAAAVFLDKWVNLHFHQIIDHEADARQGCPTFAVRVGIERARTTLQWAAAIASLAMVAVLAFVAARLGAIGLVAAGVGAVTCLAAGWHVRRARRGKRSASALVRELPWHYLGLTYAVFRVVPLVILVGLSLREPAMCLPTAVAAAVFAIDSGHSIRYQYR